MAQTETFERDYLIPKEQYNPDDHERQFNDVRQHAVNQGWRPTGDVEFIGAEMHGAVTVRLKYRVPVVLASDTEDYEIEHVRIDQAEQKALEAAVTGDKTLEEADAELAKEQAEAVRARHHEDEPTPVPDNVPEGTEPNTGPSPFPEEGEKPAPRPIDEPTGTKAATQQEQAKSTTRKRTTKKAASSSKKDGDA